MKKKLLLSFIVPFFAFPVVGCTGCAEQYEPFKMTVLEMDQQYGECILIQYKDFDMIVDTGMGADASHIKKRLNDLVPDHKLEMAVFTHAHADHIGGVANGALGDITEIGTIVDFGYSLKASDGGSSFYIPATYKKYSEIRADYVSKGTNYYPITEAVTKPEIKNYKVDDDFSINFLDAPKTNQFGGTMGYRSPSEELTSNDDLNKTSVAFYVEYHKVRLFMCGDMDGNAEAYLTMQNADVFTSCGDYTCMMKANHHGSTTSNQSTFLDLVNPKYVFISAAIIDNCCAPNQVVLGTQDSQQAHPHKDSINRFKNKTNNVWWNGVNGDITMTYDGSVKVEGAGRTKDYLIKGTNQIADREKEKNVTFFESEFYKYYQK